MKSFALHLVVVFILGAEYQHQQTFCSSSPSSLLKTTTPSTLLLSSPSPSSSLLLPSLPASASPVVERFITRAINLSPSSSGASQHQNNAKTSRTIQRLIGGHLQHSTINNTNHWPKVLFRRRPITQNTRLPQVKTTLLKRIETTTPRQSETDDESDYRDAAFLEDTNDIDSWDGGILRLSAGDGKENHVKNKKKDDSKKTLSDQVRDGKYGLIENELFKKLPKRPGIISYLSNKEVPEDNAKNYGGLKEEDIWLAEDHLLVLKGGGLNTDDTDEPWTPLDDYQAPSRQIKIPANPKVPPPFPVQFEDNGPIHFIGDHKFPFFYPKDANESLSVFTKTGYPPAEAYNNDEKNFLAGPRPPQNATNDKDNYLYPAAYPPWLFNNESFKNPFLNFGPPPQNPLPFDNESDYVDEDDPSLYYPPPYSFVYKSNYSNPVKPGPLVPGIILPPPPSAFARLEEKPHRTSIKTIPFSVVLNKISEKIPKTVLTTTTTELTTTPVIQTTQSPPVRGKDVFYVRHRTRPHTPSSTSHIPPPNTITTTPVPPTPEILSFIPQIQTTPDPLSTGKPIYYEYFDARRVPSPTGAFPDSQVPTQGPPPASPPNVPFRIPSPTASLQLLPPHKHFKPQKIYPTSIFREVAPQTRRPPASNPIQKPLRINPINVVQKPYNYNEYLYITPKPEIYPNGISSNIISQPPIRQSHKIQPSFDREVNAIRQTLQYFKSHQFQQDHSSRNPKINPLYEYAFESTTPPNENLTPNRAFTPPSTYDTGPFKPMVQYSRPVNDVNGFKAIAYPRTDNLGSSPEQNVYYSSTPRAEPLNIEVHVGDNLNNRPSSFSSTLSNRQPVEYSQPRDQRTFVGNPPQPSAKYIPQQSTILSKQPWVSIEKQVVQEIVPQNNANPYSSLRNKDINRSISGFYNTGPRNQQSFPQFQGYHYGQPFLQRPNHRFQQFPEQPFSKHIGALRAQLSQYRQQQEQPASLENDTYINTLPSRTINPEAEYINLPPRRELFQQQRLPPQSIPQDNPGNNIYRKPVDVERDILVNYKLPLPPVNPDSEYIHPQFVNRNPQQHFYQRPPQISGVQHYSNNNGGATRPLPTDNRAPNIYYVTPQRDLRYKGV